MVVQPRKASGVAKMSMKGLTPQRLRWWSAMMAMIVAPTTLTMVTAATSLATATNQLMPLQRDQRLEAWILRCQYHVRVLGRVRVRVRGVLWGVPHARVCLGAVAVFPATAARAAYIRQATIDSTPWHKRMLFMFPPGGRVQQWAARITSTEEPLFQFHTFNVECVVCASVCSPSGCDVTHVYAAGTSSGLRASF